MYEFIFIDRHQFPGYRKIPKISPGAYIFQRPFLRGLYSEGNLRLKIDFASLILGIRFTVFALFYFLFEGNFPSTSPRRELVFGGAIERRVFYVTGLGGLYLEGLIHGEAYFQNFTVFRTNLMTSSQFDCYELS